MTTNLTALLTREHAADLRRASEHHRPSEPRAAGNPKPIALRRAQADDAHALKILTELDEQPELTGDALLALIDGEAVAALSLKDGRVVANPFVATSEAVSLLKLRGRRPARRRARQPRPRWRLRFA